MKSKLSSTLDMAMKIGSFGGKATDFNRIFFKRASYIDPLDR